MPVISRFLGIIIIMYWNNHARYVDRGRHMSVQKQYEGIDADEFIRGNADPI